MAEEKADPKEAKEKKGRSGEPKESKSEEIRKKWFWPMIRENIQDILLGILFYLGFRKPAQAGGNGGQAQVPAERQTPGWLMSMFPNLTREDNNEYNLILDSASLDAKRAAKKFRDRIQEEGAFDHIRYVVNLVRARREFMEQLKHPPGENKGSDRLAFGKVTLNDPATSFLNELLEEERAGGTPEEIYERQKKDAQDRDLLPRINWMKKYRWEIIIGTPVVLWFLSVWLFN